MNFGELGCYATAEGMTEVSHTRAIDTERNSQMIVGSACVELRGRVSRISSKRHVTAVLGEKNGVSGAALNRAGPIELPYREVGVSMEAKENARCAFGIADQEAGKPLAIYRVVRNPPGFWHLFQESRWLKQDSLLRLPEQNQ